MIKKYKSLYKEQENTSQSVIQSLISMQTIDTNEEKGKFLELIQGLIYANNPIANKFLNDINNFTSKLNIEDYK